MQRPSATETTTRGLLPAGLALGLCTCVHAAAGEVDLRAAAVDALESERIHHARLLVLATLEEDGSLSPEARGLATRLWDAEDDTALDEGKALRAKLRRDRALHRSFRDFLDRELPTDPAAATDRVADLLARAPVMLDELGEACMISPSPTALAEDAALREELEELGFLPLLRELPRRLLETARAAREDLVPRRRKELKALLKEARDYADLEAQASVTRAAHREIERLRSIVRSLRAFPLEPLAAAEARGLDGTLDALERRLDDLTYEVGSRRDGQVDRNRLPEDRWEGEDREAVLREVRDSYLERYPQERVQAIRLLSRGWEERWETLEAEDMLLSTRLAYLKAAILSAQASGDLRVFLKWFRKARTPDGDTPLEPYRTTGSYLVRPENLD